jgi:hypothetical protein
MFDWGEERESNPHKLIHSQSRYHYAIYAICLVVPEGIGPSSFGYRPNALPLRYGTMYLVRVAGIEPTDPKVTGLQPAVAHHTAQHPHVYFIWSWRLESNQQGQRRLIYSQRGPPPAQRQDVILYGGTGWNRTNDAEIFSLALLPSELLHRLKLEDRAGLEPAVYLTYEIKSLMPSPLGYLSMFVNIFCSKPVKLLLLI